METLAFPFSFFVLAASLPWCVAEGRTVHRPLLEIARRGQQDVEVSHLGF